MGSLGVGGETRDLSNPRVALALAIPSLNVFRLIADLGRGLRAWHYSGVVVTRAVSNRSMHTSPLPGSSVAMIIVFSAACLDYESRFAPPEKALP
jgi:hypothetical protein